MSNIPHIAFGPLGFLIHKARATVAASLLFACIPCAAQLVNNFSEGNQSLTVEFPNGSKPQYGFHPVKLTAVNPGTKPATWEIRISEQGMNDRTLNSRGHRERIVVPPQRTVERELLVAMGRRDEHSWSYRQVEVIKPSGANDMWNPNNFSGRSSRDNGVDVPVLLTPQAAQKIKDAPSEDGEFHSRMNPASAPGDWRGYAAYALVIMTPDDWQAMPASARTALGDWTRMGGHLQFIGGMPTDAPAPDEPGQTARGLGKVHPPPVDNKIPHFRNLSGSVSAEASKSPATEALEPGQSLLQSWLARKEPDLLRDRFTIWPMVLVLLVFFVMITPINLFVLAPSKRRHRLFLTIPVISLAACALLALAVGLGDGMGGSGVRLVLIESRPGTENRQYITQWQASRCGALIGTGFTVADAAFLATLRDPGSAVTLRVEGDRLEAGGGWFTSRATQAHFLQAARASRGRIEWSGKDASGLSAVSTFDFPLRDVYLMREDNTYWHAPAMRQGETTALRAVDAEELNAKLATLFQDLPQRGDMHGLAHRAEHYIAFTDEPPAIETLGSVRWKDTGIVTGAMANP